MQIIAYSRYDWCLLHALSETVILYICMKMVKTSLSKLKCCEVLSPPKMCSDVTPHRAYHEVEMCNSMVKPKPVRYIKTIEIID
jgi:hypothetical protein